MLSEAIEYGGYRNALHLALVPGIALCLTLLAFNLLGDGVRDAIEGRDS
jgi:ABC-type dipeptide/oligopeptide/nickel transport system permease subunit